MRTLQCTVPAAFDGRPLKHLLRGELAAAGVPTEGFTVIDMWEVVR